MQSEKSESKPLKYFDSSWDFRGGDTKYSNHGFHTYPAMMIPQVARRLIETYGKDSKVMLDPFMGSGTTGVACKILDREFIGFEMKKEYFEIAEKRIDGTPESVDSYETDE